MESGAFTIRARLVDIEGRCILPAEVSVADGRIASITEAKGFTEGYLLPGFIDAHVHVESSMLVPSEFARLAVTHGTVGTISDPHEIANVLGEAGVEYMIANGRQVPFHFFFGAPSCVPATAFETAGARIDSDGVARLLARKEVLYLSEVMDFPGVLSGEAEVMRKIAHAKLLGKPIDGHAPGLHGDAATRYIGAGISTDHECFTAEEARFKLEQGMRVQVREGSAAKNFEALIDLLHDWSDRMMLCSDDKHPDSLVEGHVNDLCARAVARGIDVFKVLRAACLNPILHYGLSIGRLRVGDPADFILVEDLERFRVKRTWISGRLVAADGRSLIDRVPCTAPNRFACAPKRPADFRMPATAGDVLAIEAIDGQLITRKRWMPPTVREGALVADTEKDLLKIAVVNRYADAPPAKAWITGTGLKRGAIAGSVAHDSHNIVAVGTNDEDLCAAINLVIEHRGGISLADGAHRRVLPLPVAGIMSDADAYIVADAYAALDREAKALGSSLSAPYMTLSFMALLVIPHLKLSDLGLFDGDSFRLLA
ncbi:MAG: adenine deaminase [Flavobacteriales bacterium]|jgi:adenine deaminase|nr:MAG: adenine deaminase [Flavobacteriales bacterium]